MNRLANPHDAVLHLLDRQVVDVEGLMVCKVDDLELSESPDGTVAVTGLLAGPAALLPRFSGRAGRGLLRAWHHLGIVQAQRTTPWRIDLALVSQVDSAVRLSAGREAVLVKQTDPEGHRRLDHLLGLRVLRGEQELGRVLDVRLRPLEGDAIGCDSLVVGRGRPGSMLGYDRSDRMGPAPLRRAIRWLHRHTGQVSLAQVERIDWEGGRVHVRTGLDPLTRA